MASEDAEVAALDRVLTRTVMTKDEDLQQVGVNHEACTCGLVPYALLDGPKQQGWAPMGWGVRPAGAAGEVIHIITQAWHYPHHSHTRAKQCQQVVGAQQQAGRVCS
jgi:hypothetical protein